MERIRKTGRTRTTRRFTLGGRTTLVSQVEWLFMTSPGPNGERPTTYKRWEDA